MKKTHLVLACLYIGMFQFIGFWYLSVNQKNVANDLRVYNAYIEKQNDLLMRFQEKLDQYKPANDTQAIYDPVAAPVTPIEPDYKKLATAIADLIYGKIENDIRNIDAREELEKPTSSKPLINKKANKAPSQVYSEEEYYQGLSILDNAIITGQISDEDSEFIKLLTLNLEKKDINQFSQKIHDAVYQGNIDPRVFFPN